MWFMPDPWQVMEILAHVNKRIKGDNALQVDVPILAC